MVPRIAVADAKIELIQFRVIDDGIPNGSAAARFLPISLAPGLRSGLGEDFIARRAVRFTFGVGHGVEPPLHRPVADIIGRQISAHAKFRTAIADDDHVLHHARCAGDGVGLAVVSGLCLPEPRTGIGIKRNQPAINRAEEQLAAADRDTAIDHIATGIHGLFTRHFRIV